MGFNSGFKGLKVFSNVKHVRRRHDWGVSWLSTVLCLRHYSCVVCTIPQPSLSSSLLAFPAHLPHYFHITVPLSYWACHAFCLKVITHSLDTKDFWSLLTPLSPVRTGVSCLRAAAPRFLEILPPCVSFWVTQNGDWLAPCNCPCIKM